MNVYEIECLARSAVLLLEVNGNEGGAVMRIATAGGLLNRIDSELASVETGEELRALQVSNDIKQANLSLLAHRAIAFATGSYTGTYERSAQTLIELAQGLIQEDPSTAVAVN